MNPSNSTDLAFIGDRISRLQSELPNHVTLIAISKGVPSEAIRAAYDAGVRHFGENRVAEAGQKRSELADLRDCVWHEIGHLQSKIAKQALQIFDWIDSVDTLKLAERLNRLAAELGVRPNICLQVKLAPDPNKFGWSPDDLMAAIPQLSQFEHLTIRGLMTILPAGLPPNEILELFQNLAQLKAQICSLKLPHLPLNELSMGMSGDYQHALKAGTTQLRIGSLIFKSNYGVLAE